MYSNFCYYVVHAAIVKGLWRLLPVLGESIIFQVCAQFFLDKIGRNMALPLRGIQGQSNVIKRVDQPQISSKLTWRG